MTKPEIKLMPRPFNPKPIREVLNPSYFTQTAEAEKYFNSTQATIERVKTIVPLRDEIFIRKE